MQQPDPINVLVYSHIIKFFQTPNFTGTHRILELPGAQLRKQWLGLE